MMDGEDKKGFLQEWNGRETIHEDGNFIILSIV
jgi:hypothetical protein